MLKRRSSAQPFIAGAGFALLFAAGSVLAQQNGGVALGDHLDGHGTQQLSGIFRFFMQVVLFSGLVACASALYMGICLFFDRGPQQIQQVGWKGPIGAGLLGALLTSLPWVVLSGSQTVTDGGFDDDSWQRLQGYHQRPTQERVAEVSFIFENVESERA